MFGLRKKLFMVAHKLFRSFELNVSNEGGQKGSKWVKKGVMNE